MIWTRDKFERPRGIVLLLCVFGVLINFITAGREISTIFRQYSDFRSFYLGAALVRHGGLYDVDNVLATQRKLFGGTSRSLLPIRLPFYYALFSPLAKLSFGVGQWLWLASMTLASAIFIALSSGWGRGRAAIACCWCWPLLFSLPLGQDIALVLLVLGAALWALYARKSWWLAGLLFSLCLIKFNLFLLCPLLILGKRKWRLAAGFCTGALCLMAISFLVAGLDWPRQYAAVIFDPLESPGLRSMPNLRGLTINLGGSRVLEYLTSLAVVGMVWWVIRRRTFSIAAAATLLGSVLLSQHAYLPDCAILIPALLTLVRPASGALVRYCALLLLVPLPYELSFFQRNGSVLAAIMLLLLIAIALDFSNRRPNTAIRDTPFGPVLP